MAFPSNNHQKSDLISSLVRLFFGIVPFNKLEERLLNDSFGKSENFQPLQNMIY